jgi:hypothetical protein
MPMRTLSHARERVLRQRFFKPSELVVCNRRHRPLPAERQRRGSNLAVSPRQREDLPIRVLEWSNAATTAVSCALAFAPVSRFNSSSVFLTVPAAAAICASMRVMAASSASAMCGACST